MIKLGLMRGETTRAKLERFMTALGSRVSGPGQIYVTGGATAVLHGWRESTIDIDLKADPEPRGFFEVLAVIKNDLDINVELASPDDFIPPVPGWRERSLFIGRRGPVDFYHYDPCGQALSKLQRGHARDLGDVASLCASGLARREQLMDCFCQIKPSLIRYPAIDPRAFEAAVRAFCHAS